MDRHTHLTWCKKRALEYVNAGDLKQAFASFQSDMTKHPETNDHLGLELGTMLLIGGQLSNANQMSDWITGFN